VLQWLDPARGRGSPRRWAALLALGAVCTTISAPAQAALGGAYGTVEADRAHLAARMTLTSAGTYTVHTLTRASGLVREYTRPDGMVFAVTWQGQAKPDLRQLLGGYYNAFQTEGAAHVGRRARKPMSVNHADFVVRSGGHSGAFFGVAVLPRAAPPSFSMNDLK
jgi:hypothetical protein